MCPTHHFISELLWHSHAAYRLRAFSLAVTPFVQPTTGVIRTNRRLRMGRYNQHFMEQVSCDRSISCVCGMIARTLRACGHADTLSACLRVHAVMHACISQLPMDKSPDRYIQDLFPNVKYQEVRKPPPGAACLSLFPASLTAANP